MGEDGERGVSPCWEADSENRQQVAGQRVWIPGKRRGWRTLSPESCTRSLRS